MSGCEKNLLPAAIGTHVSQSVSFIAVPRAHYTTVSPLQCKFSVNLAAWYCKTCMFTRRKRKRVPYGVPVSETSPKLPKCSKFPRPQVLNDLRERCTPLLAPIYPFDRRSALSPRARFATSVIAEVLAIGRGAACAIGPVDTVSRDGPQENIVWVYGESTHSDGGCRSPWTANQTEKGDPGAHARHTGDGHRS